jgi:hypothetical protein
VSRLAKRVWLGVGGLLVFGGSWFAIFHFALPYALLPIGPLVFLVSSLGAEWVVPLSADERAEKNQEIIQESENLELVGFWKFSLLCVAWLVFVAIVVLGFEWLKHGMTFLDSRTAIALAPPLLVLLISIPLSYWYDRRRLRKMRDKIERESAPKSPTLS